MSPMHSTNFQWMGIQTPTLLHVRSLRLICRLFTSWSSSNCLMCVSKNWIFLYTGLRIPKFQTQTDQQTRKKNIDGETPRSPKTSKDQWEIRWYVVKTMPPTIAGAWHDCMCKSSNMINMAELQIFQCVSWPQHILCGAVERAANRSCHFVDLVGFFLFTNPCKARISQSVQPLLWVKY